MNLPDSRNESSAGSTSEQRVKANRKRLAFSGGICISGLFAYLAFRGLHPEQMLRSLGSIQLGYVLAGMLGYGLAIVVIALRWQFLLRAVKLVPLRALCELVTIGYMGNNVYPLRAGDGLRIVLLRRDHQVPLARVTTVVVLERAFDGCVMIAFVLIGLLFIDLQSSEVEGILRLAAPAFVAAMLVALFLAAKPDLLRALVGWLSKRLPSRLSHLLLRLSEDVIAGLKGLRNPLHFLGAVLSSFTTWSIEAGTYWLVMMAFSMRLDNAYAVSLLICGAVNLAGIIPASPGQIGVNEFITVAILTALGVPAALAGTYAIVAHIAIWLPSVLGGLYFLLRKGLGWADIGRAGELEGVG
ncbi:MAG: flippase-like domain-containing protein [Chloroflexi bacterium]|nr:flippase-like domain-containing protein [Chloroflexota bacterium]MXX50222.1 flippase-like domain-containing protein [Chloroflexota bacterium]MXX82664.1 flippase-like domain-containing protein [Chloroflexota bacterium]MYA92828.1 flippase-like domain-containing protein [Chloroflexota bacterium]MYC55458.1 flippase-like domain-containing protein [Chloroflexota bacterium]